ncbi:5619_t:CDS:2, partial [Scutellospora calospora]
SKDSESKKLIKLKKLLLRGSFGKSKKKRLKMPPDFDEPLIDISKSIKIKPI